MEDKAEKLRKSKAEYQRKYRKSKVHYSLYYSAKENETIVSNAAKAKLKPAHYIKDVTLKKHIQAVDPSRENILATKAEIRRIGVNVNQMAKAINETYGNRDFDLFQRTLSVMSEKLQLILVELRS